MGAGAAFVLLTATAFLHSSLQRALLCNVSSGFLQDRSDQGCSALLRFWLDFWKKLSFFVGLEQREASSWNNLGSPLWSFPVFVLSGAAVLPHRTMLRLRGCFGLRRCKEESDAETLCIVRIYNNCLMLPSLNIKHPMIRGRVQQHFIYFKLNLNPCEFLQFLSSNSEVSNGFCSLRRQKSL